MVMLIAGMIRIGLNECNRQASFVCHRERETYQMRGPMDGMVLVTAFDLVGSPKK